jgi:uncharacterized protein YdaU (DUF1376 family)
MGDYQRDTGHLSLSQDGAYRRMMDHYYSTESPLPIEKPLLYRICGAMDKAEKESVDYVASKFFVAHDGKLYHQRIDEEISKASEKIANLKANGASGGVESGKQRLTKIEANASANVEAKTNNTNTNTNTKPIGLEKHTAQPLAVLPDWLPERIWDDWVAHRKSIRAKLTPRAAVLCIEKLAELRGAGNDPVAVIEQSIMSGKWTGLFPLKNTQNQPQKSGKFDPTAFINRHRNGGQNAQIIDI